MKFFAKGLILVATLPLVYAGWTVGDIWQTSKRDDRSPADAIVVMGAAQYDGRPSPVFRARLDHARSLYDQRVAPLIVVLGGKRQGDRFTEAEAGAAYLEQDLPADRVTGVKSGSTTLESLRNFTGLASDRNIERIVIVSHPLHLARAREMAESFGFEVAVSGVPSPAEGESMGRGLIREAAFLTYFRILRRG